VEERGLAARCLLPLAAIFAALVAARSQPVPPSLAATAEHAARTRGGRRQASPSVAAARRRFTLWLGEALRAPWLSPGIVSRVTAAAGKVSEGRRQQRSHPGR